MKTLSTIAILLLFLLSLSGCDLSPEGLEEHMATVPKSHEIQDAKVTENIYKAFNNQAELDGLSITVITTKGDVKLSGIVSNKKQLAIIDHLVRNTEGVHTIHNHLTLE